MEYWSNGVVQWLLEPHLDPLEIETLSGNRGSSSLATPILQYSITPVPNRAERPQRCRWSILELSDFSRGEQSW
jgi:hypothetical protein